MGKIFSFHGTASRREYALILFGCLVFALGLQSLAYSLSENGANAVVLLLGIGIIYVIACAAVRRLHDLKKNGAIAILLLIPIVNSVLAAYLLFGKRETAAMDPYSYQSVGNALQTRIDQTWIYATFSWRFPEFERGWRLSETYHEPNARLDIWQRFQGNINIEFQKRKDQGWQPIGGEPGPGSIILNEKSSQRDRTD
jgi:uncharacterized membrane protein YhaH (DUF805 family)